MEKLSRIPGRDQVGELDATKIEEWVKQVRAGCKELGRQDVCERSLGKLFSTAPIGDDGVWPCKPVRDVLKNIATDMLSNGVKTALYNARGAQGRGEGGGQERELADKYRNWAKALEFTHPRVSKIHMEMAVDYEREAEWQDTDAVVSKRLRY